MIDRGEVILRRWRPKEDFEVLFQVIEESLDHLRPWMPWVAEHSRQATADFLARCGPQWERGEAYNYAITYRGAVVGSCSVFGVADPRGREIGYWLHPAVTGHGLTTLAAMVLTEQAFMLLDVTYVEIVHDVANVASGVVARRAGFAEVRRQEARPPLAPGESGTDGVWRLSRPLES